MVYHMPEISWDTDEVKRMVDDLGIEETVKIIKGVVFQEAYVRKWVDEIVYGVPGE